MWKADYSHLLYSSCFLLLIPIAGLPKRNVGSVCVTSGNENDAKVSVQELTHSTKRNSYFPYLFSYGLGNILSTATYALDWWPLDVFDEGLYRSRRKNKCTVENSAKQVMSTLPQVQGPRSTGQAQPPPGGTSEGLRDKMLNTANNFIKKI